MAGGQLHTLLGELRRRIGREGGCPLTDAQLLDDFVTRRDEAAFEVLVWRHGTMVLSLCRRVLRDGYEAEDAFQATFLVFARKAGSIGRREAVAAWLHKVAYRVALRARARAAMRLAVEKPLTDLPAPNRPDDLLWRDLRPVLDEEIDRLPEKYRAPFVLCYLQGHTNEEAAERLGCPKGTVLSRLARGRERLRSRLARRGVVLSAGWFAAAPPADAAPAALVSSTVEAGLLFAAGEAVTDLVRASVTGLTQGVLHAMFLTKLKVATAALLAALAPVVLAPGIGALAHQAPAERPAAKQPAAAERPLAPKERPELAKGDILVEEESESELTGLVEAVAKDGKSFTVISRPRERGEEPKRADVLLGDKMTITYHAVGPNGATPTRGYGVRVKREGGKEVALSVTFQGSVDPFRRRPDLVAVVAGVSRDGKKVSLEERSRGREEAARRIDLQIDDKTRVVYHNVPAGGAKVAEGFQAQVWLREGSEGRADEVSFIGKAEAGSRPLPRGRGEGDLPGKVVEVSGDGRTITLEQRPLSRGDRLRAGGEEPKKVTVRLDDKTAVVYHNVPPGGTRVAEGFQAHVRLKEGSGKVAARVNFIGVVKEKWAPVGGKVVGVSKDGKTITLERRPQARGEEPGRLDVKLTDKTRIAYTNVGPGEAKPTEGYFAQVRLVEGSKDTAAGVLFGKPGGERRR
jgi:RNA polymerase sigma factor (sigma-70 family)